jgi:hypothetical protein
MTGPIPPAAAERAATRYRVMGGCWISTYSRGSHGYAQVSWQTPMGTQTTTAHRAAWTHHNGPIPAGLTIDHHKAAGCTDTGCVRPDHLRLLTNLANATDNGAVNRRTLPTVDLCHCGDTRVRRADGRLICRGCTSRTRREWRARRRAAGLPAI